MIRREIISANVPPAGLDTLVGLGQSRQSTRRPAGAEHHRRHPPRALGHATLSRRCFPPASHHQRPVLAALDRQPRGGHQAERAGGEFVHRPEHRHSPGEPWADPTRCLLRRRARLATAGKRLTAELSNDWEPMRRKLRELFSGPSGEEALRLPDQAREVMMRSRLDTLQRQAAR